MMTRTKKMKILTNIEYQDVIDYLSTGETNNNRVKSWIDKMRNGDDLDKKVVELIEKACKDPNKLEDLRTGKGIETIFGSLSKPAISTPA